MDIGGFFVVVEEDFFCVGGGVDFEVEQVVNESCFEEGRCRVGMGLVYWLDGGGVVLSFYEVVVVEVWCFVYFDGGKISFQLGGK